MDREVVVADSGPLIGLARIGRVEHRLQSSRALALLKVELDEGEAEAVMLANELKARPWPGARLLLMDERKGRVRAERMQLRVMGTIGILLLAKARGADIDLPETLDRLRSNNEGFWCSTKGCWKTCRPLVWQAVRMPNTGDHGFPLSCL